MKTIYQVGIVGCGMISEIYIQNIQTLFSDALAVRGVFDQNQENVRRRAEQFALPCRYSTMEQMLQDPLIDIVLDLCPPAAHYSVNRQALEAGKHVYSEKPLAATFDQGQHLVELARQKGVRLGCSPDVPLGSMIQTARKLVEDGAIGRVVGATANLIKQGVETWHPNPNFLYQPGGGPLMDMGPYYLTALLHIVGPFASVSAMDAISFPTRRITSEPHYGEIIQVNVPTYVNALLQFTSGALATFTATFDVWNSKLPYLEIYGETGSILVSDPNRFGGPVMLAKPGSTYEQVPVRFPYGDNSRGLGLHDMAEAISGGTIPRADGQYALHILETMTAISTSAREGVRIQLNTACGKPMSMPE
ncbi:MAG: Gfo/Idh/MocA family oxidoreductase [Eubacteriales bacterium]|nr:Gfo/Idh/MocA family oxidoreductase [Clostridiales bacterium]MDO5544355.1 Gfo/Idh/MocA family oxidoreductase [Eubacteriales bacterium]